MKHLTLAEELELAIGQARGVLAQLGRLRDRVTVYEQTIGADEPCPLQLPPQERVVYGLLMKRPQMALEAAVVALWGGKPDVEMPKDADAVVRIAVYKLRRKLAALEPGLADGLVTVSGSAYGRPSYYFKHETKDRLRALAAENLVKSAL